jgi:dCMP deaminase
MAKEALVHITNGFRTVTELEEHVHTLNLASSQWTRPSWGSYFMELAHLTARRTNCMKRAVGAVLVSSNRVVATGYNGTPMNTINCAEGGCLRCNQGEASAGQLLDSCLCLHAEENALLEVGRSGARGATMYCTTCPCIGCAKKIVQSGVAVVVFDREYSMDDMTRQLFAQAGVKLERVSVNHSGRILSFALSQANGARPLPVASLRITPRDLESFPFFFLMIPFHFWKNWIEGMVGGKFCMSRKFCAENH